MFCFVLSEFKQKQPQKKDAGDIGYWATGKIPIRKSILDSLYTRNGTLAEDDSPGFYPIEENPHVINPKEGYVEACNNRLHDTDEFHGQGTTFLTSSRAVRADRLLRDRIRSGKKIDIEFFKQVQTDLIDVYAIEMSPLLIKVVEKMKGQFFREGSREMGIINKLIKYLDKWNGDTSAESTPALIFNLWNSQLANMMVRQYFPNDYEQFSVTASFFSFHFLGNMARKWAKMEDLDSDFCKTADNAKSDIPCAYNVVYALLKAYEDMTNQLGHDESNWKWGYMNLMEFAHVPFSETFLKPFFHYTVPFPVFFEAS